MHGAGPQEFDKKQLALFEVKQLYHSKKRHLTQKYDSKQKTNKQIDKLRTPSLCMVRVHKNLTRSSLSFSVPIPLLRHELTHADTGSVGPIHLCNTSGCTTGAEQRAVWGPCHLHGIHITAN